MKYTYEYRDKRLAGILLELIHKETAGKYHFMEVCGSHTHAIRRFGLYSLLPGSIELLSGPGCPVCVTGRSFIDKAVELALGKDTIIVTYGDLLRVPGNSASLQQAREGGADIRIIYSSTDALRIAYENRDKIIIFPAIGFETTAPSTAVTVINAQKQNLNNFFILSGHKVMPPVMEAVIEEGIPLNGYICPGHVSAITGSSIYESIAEKYKVATVVSGFEPLDILQTVLMLIRQVNHQDFKTEIQYKRVVSPEGNTRARMIMDTVFERKDDYWRGFGIIPFSGLKLKEKYSDFDAELHFNIDIPEQADNNGCICGDIVKGKKNPGDCPLFIKICNPVNPVGACMVSAEGSCNAHYKYKNDV